MVAVDGKTPLLQWSRASCAAGYFHLLLDADAHHQPLSHITKSFKMRI